MRPAVWGLPVCGLMEVPGLGTLGDEARPPPDSKTEFDGGAELLSACTKPPVWAVAPVV